MQGYKKFILVGIVTILFVTSVILIARPSKATLGMPLAAHMVATIVNDIPQTRNTIWQKITLVLDRAKSALTTQLINQTLSTFMNKLAYDMASNLATGGPGRTPLFERESFTKSLDTARDAALGEFIGQLSKNSFEDLGFNLCDPSLSVKLSLTLSLIDSKAPPRPTCNWREVQNEWAKFGDNFTSDLIKLHLDTRGGSKNLEDFFANGFSLEQTDLGVFAKLDAAARKAEQDAVEAKKSLIAQCSGYLSNRTPITQEQLNSCQDVLQMTGATIKSTIDTEVTKIATSGLKKEISVIGQIMKTAGTIFVNTFTSKLMHKWIQGGMCSLLDGGCSRIVNNSNNSSLRDNLLAQLRGGAEVSKSNEGLFIGFGKIEPSIVESYNILEEYSICPEDAQFRTPDNCVISSDFLQAVHSRVSLQDAIDKGLISGSLPLIGRDDNLRNANKECYKSALCYSNLVKLRKANVIPVGWELAALASPLDKPVTLQQAIDCFEEDTGKCQFAPASATANNPFYHLVDPYWILKAPAALCNAYVYSPILESPDTNNRQQYCADVKTCLREDENGNCLSGEYGYCTKTENIWRFSGDECKDGDIYSGCLTFRHSSLPLASYLEQSLDYCSGDQVGCKRYSQEKNNDGNWVLQDIVSDDNDLFLNNKSATCPSDMAGCSEFIVMAADTGTNLVANGSFTATSSSSVYPEGWFRNARTSVIPSNGAVYDNLGGRIANGYSYDDTLVHHPDAERFEQKIALLPNTTYIISASAARYDAATQVTARVSLLMCDESGNCDSNNSPNNTNLAGPVDGVGIRGTTCIIPNKYNFDLRFSPSGTAMERESCTFTTNTYTYGVLLNLLTTTGPGLAWFDDVKLEIVSDINKTASAYSEYGLGGKINMNGNRFMCTASEMGCQGYTPTNGDPMIPAVIGQNDLCPNECVGYASFAEAPDHFDLVENSAATYNYFNFIPKTADSCPATAAGCEEFTNVDAVADGGEGREYYTYLRQCVAVNLGVDYITWEGSDVAGYQIRAWKALPSNVPSAVGVAPCTNIRPGQNTCNDNGVGAIIAACGPETPSTLDDPNVNANCRQFFDPAGNIFYRLQDKVIFASDDCHDYRRTINGQIYRAMPEQSTRCAASQNGCRAYYGNNANNVRDIFSDDFERAVYTPWQGVTSAVSLSSESLERNGRSLKITSSNVLNAAAAVVPLGSIQNKKQYEISWWMKSSTVLSSVRWELAIPSVDGASDLTVRLGAASDSSLLNTPANSWHNYKTTHYLDLLEAQLSLYNLNNASLRIIGMENAVSENVDVFIDNVIFKEVASNIYVIRNSWETPVACDSPYTGYHLGCQTYLDTNSRQYNLKSFQNLCRVEAIGCMAVIDTRNSDNPFAETFNEGDVSSVTVAADTVTYLVPDNRKFCSAVYQGCQALGLPDRINPDYLPTVYKINDPDQYTSSLCLSDDLNCEEYSSDKGAYYFKDPGGNTCTYQANVLVAGNVVSGWFKTATLRDPLPLGCLDTNNAYDAGDFDLQQNVAACPADKNLCTAFYDPADPINCNSVGTCTGCAVAADCANMQNERECRAAGGIYEAPDCQAYYYYNNSKIDKASCAGQVNQNNGCVLFKEANNWNGDHSILNVNYDSSQSYALNLARASSVSPVTCDPVADPATCTLDANVLLKVAKDRQCGEWLACRSSSVVWDKDNSKYKVVCSDMGTCIKYDSTNNITKCAEWSDAPVSALTLASYQDRATGVNDRLQFGDDDYTGYSIPNMLPLPTLTVTNIGSATAPNPQLIYDAGTCAGSTCSAFIAGEQFNGVCRGGRCLVNPTVAGQDIFGVETRGYAQVDSPFPSSISPDQGRLDRLQSYAGANICEVDQVDPIIATPNGCEITYVKVTYGSGAEVRYYPNNLPSPNGICSSGNTGDNIDCVDSAGNPHNNLCDTYNNDGSSRSDGSCSKKVKAETISNWPGICLEYDSSAKVVNDTNGTYYCNQWYPADQIAGTSSLFDNYREAGYYEPAGREALFCAVTGPFQTYDERVYCLASSNTAPNECNALAMVPAGSKINASSMSNNSSVVSYGFLKEEAFTMVPAEGSAYDYPSNAGFEQGIGLDRIEKNGLSGGATYSESRFSSNDFILASNARANEVPVINLSLLSKIFVPPLGEEIAIFYLDEDIDYQFNVNQNARIWIGDILQASPNNPVNTVACLDDGTAWTDQDNDPDDNSSVCSVCDPDRTWHSVMPSYCNPLPYNYYLRPIVRSSCATDCSDNLANGLRGQSCLATHTAYTSIDTAGGCASTDYACRFASCVQAVREDGPTDACREYGQIRYGTRFSLGIRDVQLVEGCLGHLFSTARVEPSPGSIDGLIKKPGISDALVQAVIGSTSIVVANGRNFYVETVGSVDSEGCLEPRVVIDADCEDIEAMSDVNACYYRRFSTGNEYDYCSSYVYTHRSLGSTCSGATCYQQCQIVTQLDPGGDKSWVRTDIWWRNEIGGSAGRNNYPSPNTWLSYYYKSGFIQNDKVNYSGITGENVKFTHFGSALGFLANDVVNVRVPITASIFSPLSAVTFYASEAEGLNVANQQLAYLFYRTYNLRWDTITQSYLPNGNANYQGTDIYTGTAVANRQNTVAGPDFDPVILQVCGTDVCRDASGSILRGFTINDLQDQRLTGKNSVFAAFKFYYYAHPDHMPVKNIVIDWGDASNDTSAPGKYKNNIPDCNPDLAMPGQTSGKQGFGGTDRACREAYKTFYHDYQYSTDSAFACDGSSGKPVVYNDSYLGVASGYAACYRPTVTVQDHWYTTGTAFQASETYGEWVVVHRD